MKPRTAERIKQWIPKPLYPSIRLVYRRFGIRFLCCAIEISDLLLRRKYEGKKLPPAILRYKVQMSPRGRVFARIGRRVSSSLVEALRLVGKEPSSVLSVLDFGCGCGRTLLWIKDALPNTQLFGTDTDASLIAWCQRHLSFGTFSNNASTPPLEYGDESFDVVYAVSVFTHLDEKMQFLWLEEIKRVTKKDGIVLLTVLAENAWHQIPEQYLDVVKEKGFVYIDSKLMKGLLPDWYQATFHSRAYVEKTFSNYFKVLKYMPGGINRNQDLVVLQRNSDL